MPVTLQLKTLKPQKMIPFCDGRKNLATDLVVDRLNTSFGGAGHISFLPFWTRNLMSEPNYFPREKTGSKSSISLTFFHVLCTQKIAASQDRIKPLIGPGHFSLFLKSKNKINVLFHWFMFLRPIYPHFKFNFFTLVDIPTYQS